VVWGGQKLTTRAVGQTAGPPSRITITLLLADCPPTHQILKEQVLSYKNRASWAEGRTRKAEDKFTDLEMLNATLTCQMQVRNWSYNLDSDNSLKKD
jgi:hypothetical protein